MKYNYIGPIFKKKKKKKTNVSLKNLAMEKVMRKGQGTSGGETRSAL